MCMYVGMYVCRYFYVGLYIYVCMHFIFNAIQIKAYFVFGVT